MVLLYLSAWQTSKHFQKCSDFKIFLDFQVQISEPKIGYNYSTYALADFPFPSTKAQEYFGCGWYVVKPGFTCFKVLNMMEFPQRLAQTEIFPCL